MFISARIGTVPYLKAHTSIYQESEWCGHIGEYSAVERMRALQLYAIIEMDLTGTRGPEEAKAESAHICFWCGGLKTLVGVEGALPVHLVFWASLVAQLVKNPPSMRETWV